MFSWLKKEGEKTESIENVIEGLKRIYKTKLLPLELHYQFHDFHSPQLEEPDFDAKPMILLVGQYSTGKTTFIKYLLERDFPGIRIGPEPTTDRFIAVMYDEKESIIPGNALVVDPKKQFRPLSKFGNAFLNRFQCSTVPSPVLKGISIVDTPGILSGEKQRVDRGYDFTGVLEWFAERVDRIILLFDAHKLDISDEFRRSIEALRGHDDKIRIVLNKADMIDHQQLMRVYGALMWSLGKVLQTPEVARVYIGSFWDQPLRYDVNRRLFEDEEQDLFRDMQSLPRNAALRKLNDLIKRARLAKVHAYIVSELRKEMPSMFGKDGKKKDLIKNLGQVYDRIQKEQQISPGDFPDIKKMQECLVNHDFTRFHPLKPKLLEVVDNMLATDISKLMAMIPQEEINVVTEPLIKGGAFEGVEDQVSPFGYGRGEGVDAGHGDPDWICSKEKPRYDQIFQGLGPVDGKVTGAGTHSLIPIDTHTLIPTDTETLTPTDTSDAHAELTFQALLSATRNCTLLTEMLYTVLRRDQVNANYDNIAGALAAATKPCESITQGVTSSNSSQSLRFRSDSAVSIRTMQGIEGGEEHCVDNNVTHNIDPVNDYVNVSDITVSSSMNTVSKEWKIYTILRKVLFFVKLISLFILNMVAILIVIQVMFMAMLYVVTGRPYLEWSVETSPVTWYDSVRAYLVGPSAETTRISTIVQLYYPSNIDAMAHVLIDNIQYLGVYVWLFVLMLVVVVYF